MYLRYYGLEKKPFDITPDPEFLFLGDSHKEALAAIVYGVENRKGFVVITGEVGLGKTTIVRSYLKQFSSQKLETVLIFNTKVSFQELMVSIYDDLDIPMKTEDQFQLVLGFQNYLIENYKKGSNLVLIIDEAQHLPVETLEALRMLSNLETSKEKLLQVILIGQPELSNLLELQELRQLKQRIAVQTALAPLTRQESLEYISHRIQKAGGDIDQLFTKGALKRIVAYAEGIPRKIQILCDNALVAGLGYQKKPVTAKIVNEAIGDMERKSATKPKFFSKAVFAAAVLLLFSAGAFYFFFANNFFPGGDSIATPVAGSADSKDNKASKSLPTPPAKHDQIQKSAEISRTPSKALTKSSPPKTTTSYGGMASEKKDADQQPSPEKNPASPTAIIGEIPPKPAKTASDDTSSKQMPAASEDISAKPAVKTPETKDPEIATSAPKPSPAQSAESGSQKPVATTTKSDTADTASKPTKAASTKPEPKAAAAAPSKPEPKAEAAAPSKPEPKAEAAASTKPEPKAAAATPSKPEPKAATAAPSKPEPKAAAAAPSKPEPKAATAASTKPEPKAAAATPSKPEPKAATAASTKPEPKAAAATPSKPEPKAATAASTKPEDKTTDAQDAGFESEKEDASRNKTDEPDAMDLMDWVLKNK